MAHPEAWLEGRPAARQDEIAKDNLSIVAAGVAFYGLFAIFPAITAFVTLYGLFTDPAEVEQQLSPLRDVMPEDVFGILQQQMHSVVGHASGSLGLGLLLSLALTIWSSTKGYQGRLHGSEHRLRRA